MLTRLKTTSLVRGQIADQVEDQVKYPAADQTRWLISAQVGGQTVGLRAPIIFQLQAHIKAEIDAN